MRQLQPTLTANSCGPQPFYRSVKLCPPQPRAVRQLEGRVVEVQLETAACTALLPLAASNRVLTIMHDCSLDHFLLTWQCTAVLASDCARGGRHSSSLVAARAAAPLRLSLSARARGGRRSATQQLRGSRKQYRHGVVSYLTPLLSFFAGHAACRSEAPAHAVAMRFDESMAPAVLPVRLASAICNIHRGQFVGSCKAKMKFCAI